MDWSRKPPNAKSFKEDQENEEAYETIERGLSWVPVGHIVGSVGRYHDLDSEFRLKQHIPQERLLRVKKAMRQGKPLPPVKLYKIKDKYYVLDGNHRVSAAKEFGYNNVNAKIVEFIPSKNSLENILYREKSEFKDKTGLSYSIDLTEVDQYSHLITQINKHQTSLKQTSVDPVSLEVAAEDWYKTVYKPMTAIIEKCRLIDSFPQRTVADLYTYITFHQWERKLIRKYGSRIDKLISTNMEDFRKNMANKNELEYPDMLQEITAFVLMNVSAKREHRIVERLFALKEIKEVHEVHGNVDILVKVVLKRDLVSSDAEIIGHFVHDNVGLIPGVLSTQTLIPGVSKTKP